MTLEDFFAATEMKDGLTTLTRVEELLSVMKATVDSEVVGSSEATRQWAAVGSVLSATEKSECLNHFVQLNGLSFLNQWLQQSHKWSNDGSDDSVENLVNVLLGVLDRLPVDKEKSAASGIGSAVTQLYGHRSHDIRERARTLFNKWNHEEGTDSKSQSGLENGASCDNGPVNPGFEDSPTDKEPGENGDSCSEGSSGDRIQDVRPPSDQNSPLVSSPAVHHESSIEPVAGFSPGGGEPDSRVDDSSGKDSSDGSKDVEIGVNTEEIDTFRDNVGDEGTTGDLKEVEESGRLNDELDSMVSSASLKPTGDADINEVERRSEAGLGVSEGDGASEEEDDLPVSKDPLCSSSPERSWGPNLGEEAEEAGTGPSKGNDPPCGNSSRTSDYADRTDAGEPEAPSSFRVQQSYGDASKGNCGFDLNEDISLEEDAEGSSPSSPQRVAADGGEAVPGSALKPNFMDIDLNVVDDDDGVAAGKLSGRGDSSMEVSSGRAERFSVDLNCIGNEDASPHQSPFRSPNRHESSLRLFPASSFSSRLPSPRDFDLNDDPSALSACGSSGLGIAPRGTSSLRNYPDGYSDFLIMGSRAQDERRELFTENSQAFLGSILCVDLAAGSRRPPPYPPISPPPPPPGYSGLSIGPGSFQYMVDPRGAAVVPQSAADTSSRAAAPSTLTSVGPPTLNLELDCTAALTGGRSLRQLFMPGSSGLAEEPPRPSSHPAAGTGMVLKRKEPDCGWEPCKLSTNR
ncbi:unnamed protein product [Spirodela intermedia]|uniref:TFIIS N-terminal domain-containing protein n=1 Tax=Spirodela intermedia TaxID=51605 RepID=A0A7I8KPX9_SPIIN|nr:unnamed protein product [Spirodela intermedia]